MSFVYGKKSSFPKLKKLELLLQSYKIAFITYQYCWASE